MDMSCWESSGELSGVRKIIEATRTVAGKCDKNAVDFLDFLACLEAGVLNERTINSNYFSMGAYCLAICQIMANENHIFHHSIDEWMMGLPEYVKAHFDTWKMARQNSYADFYQFIGGVQSEEKQECNLWEIARPILATVNDAFRLHILVYSTPGRIDAAARRWQDFLIRCSKQTITARNLRCFEGIEGVCQAISDMSENVNHLFNKQIYNWIKQFPKEFIVEYTIWINAQDKLFVDYLETEESEEAGESVGVGTILKI